MDRKHFKSVQHSTLVVTETTTKLISHSSQMSIKKNTNGKECFHHHEGGIRIDSWWDGKSYSAALEISLEVSQKKLDSLYYPVRPLKTCPNVFMSYYRDSCSCTPFPPCSQHLGYWIILNVNQNGCNKYIASIMG